MMKDDREYGYFLVDGVVVHGLVGLVGGRRISFEDAQALCAQRRAEQVQREPAATAEEPSVIAGRLAELEAKNAQLEADMQKLLALAAKGFAA